MRPLGERRGRPCERGALCRVARLTCVGGAPRLASVVGGRASAVRKLSYVPDWHALGAVVRARCADRRVPAQRASWRSHRENDLRQRKFAAAHVGLGRSASREQLAPAQVCAGSPSALVETHSGEQTPLRPKTRSSGGGAHPRLSSSQPQLATFAHHLRRRSPGKPLLVCTPEVFLCERASSNPKIMGKRRARRDAVIR